ncbi:MAG: allantoinase AllB [Opitutales bacterium]
MPDTNETRIENVRLPGLEEPRNVRLADGCFQSLDDRDPVGSAAVIDAEGCWLLPGMVDAHVHFNEPGRTHWEGWTTGSRAAALGGVTTVVEMPLNAIPPTNTPQAFAEKRAAAEGKSHVDFALWGGLVPDNLDQLEDLADSGVVGFKAFMSPSGTDDFAHSDATVLKSGMKVIQRTGLPLAIHAEAPAVLDREAACPHPDTASGFEASRPREAELEAIRIALDLAGETACRVHIVHVSCPEGVDLINQYQQQGVDVTCETCTHYLRLTLADVERLGPVAKCAPPVRSPDAREALWERLRSGHLQTVGSDHSPSPWDLKATGSFTTAWGGISGIQHAWTLLLHAHFAEDRCPLDRLCETVATAPAHRLGLDSHKRGLVPGAHADGLLYDPATRETITQTSLAYQHPHSPYVGQTIGTVRRVFLRGQTVAHEGAVVGAPRGRLLRPVRSC